VTVTVNDLPQSRCRSVPGEVFVYKRKPGLRPKETSCSVHTTSQNGVRPTPQQELAGYSNGVQRLTGQDGYVHMLQRAQTEFHGWHFNGNIPGTFGNSAKRRPADEGRGAVTAGMTGTAAEEEARGSTQDAVMRVRAQRPGRRLTSPPGARAHRRMATRAQVQAHGRSWLAWALFSTEYLARVW
jgi:hypothetical protein